MPPGIFFYSHETFEFSQHEIHHNLLENYIDLQGFFSTKKADIECEKPAVFVNSFIPPRCG